MKKSFYINTSADAIAYDKPCYLKRLLLLVGTTGGDVTIYDGRDSSSGRKVATVEAIANETKTLNFGNDLLLERGCFIDIGSNVTEVTAILEPYETPE